MRKTIQELTGLRGVAALLILIGHSVGVAPVLKDLPTAALMNVLTFCGMSVFFVLSGIVICYNYCDSVVDCPKVGVPKFFLARFARLWPLYVLVVLGSFVLDFLIRIYHHEAFGPDSAAEFSALPIYLAGMQSWFYGFINDKQLVYIMGPGSITWSVSTEFALYFAFIPVAWLIRKTRISGMFLFVLGCVLYLTWYGFAYYTPCLAGFFDRLFPGHPGQAATFFTYRFPLPRFFEFLSGCGIALLYRADFGEKASRMIRVLVVCGLCAAAALIALMSSHVIDFDGCRNMIASPCTAVLTLGVCTFGSRLLRSRPLAFMGDVSYSTYLIHPFIGVFIGYFGYQASHAVPNLLVHFGLTYVLVWFVYNWYEVPMRRKIREFFL